MNIWFCLTASVVKEGDNIRVSSKQKAESNGSAFFVKKRISDSADSCRMPWIYFLKMTTSEESLRIMQRKLPRHILQSFFLDTQS